MVPLLLIGSGSRVKSCAAVAEANEILNNEPAEVVFLANADRSNWSALESFGERWPGLPVVILGEAGADPSSAQQALGQGPQITWSRALAPNREPQCGRAALEREPLHFVQQAPRTRDALRSVRASVDTPANSVCYLRGRMGNLPRRLTGTVVASVWAMRGVLNGGLLAGFLLTGCSDYLSDADSGGQVSLMLDLTGAEREAIVFTLDDSPNASALRTELASQFLKYTAYQRVAEDPARWEAVSLDVVIVRPSEPPSTRFHTSVDDPRLHWESPNRTPAGAKHFQAGVAAAIQESIGDGAAPLALLESWARATDLMMEREVSVTPGERRLVEVTTRDFPAIASYLLTANDDRSPLPAAAYQREYTPAAWSASVIWAGGERAKKCESKVANALPRLNGWLNKNDRVEHWPCEDSWVFARGVADGYPRCIDPSIAVVDGQAQCRILVDTRGSCATARGWDNSMGSNEMRVPSFVNNSSGLRTCEMVQLEGAALESCRHDLQCTDCKPGWCWTEVPELTRARACREGSVPFSRFRMVLGADMADSAYAGPVRITCNLAPK
ncbi:MAG: hypothetical protein SFV15_02760 [Polyangiaceae bacterium]|nr:hypothetical protein [Polyangiaceae bacterium]